jgi:enoyl-CoA hydratase/carnithine racemase
MWTWAMTMGIRKFQEMVFTGRPFTAKEMYDCNFVNSVVPRDKLESEVDKYASACSRCRPTDAVVMQKSFFQMMKQFQGEYMGSLLSGFLESMGGRVRPDAEDLMLGDEVYDSGLNNAVKVNDNLFPPDFRLSKSGRAEAE